MGISFKILWIDDNFKAVERDVAQVEKLLTDKGFRAIIEKKNNAEELLDTDKVNNYDLLLCDLNLSNTKSGKDLVDNIRSNDIFTETILYSGNAEKLYMEMKSYASKGNLPPERMSFCAGVDNLWDKVKNVILAMIKKSQDIRQIRGRIITEVVKIEYGLERVMFDFFSNQEEEAQKKYLEKYKNKIVSFSESNLKKAQKLVLNCSEFESSTLVTAGNVMIMLQSVLTQLGNDIKSKKEITEGLIKKLEYIQKEIIPVRNNLAHLVEQDKSDGQVYFANPKRGKFEDVFNEERFVEIRKKILEHISVVNDLESFFRELK